MSKKKQHNNNQPPMSDERFIKERMRNLEIGYCYCTEENLRNDGEGVVIISRKHTGGKVSVCCFLLDTFCLGVKDVNWLLRAEDDDLEEVVSHYDNIDLVDYVTAHNWIYGALAFAEDAGIQPCKEYRTAQYFLQEDDDDVPLLEFPFGKNGKHFLVAHDQAELNRYLPVLRKNLGDDYTFVLKDGVEDEAFDDEEEEEVGHENIFGIDKRYSEFDSVYSYQHPVFPQELTLHHQIVYDVLAKERDNEFFTVREARKLLSLPKEELREDLERIILYILGRLYDDTATDPEYLAIGDAIMLLGEVGNSNSSFDVLLEVLHVPFEIYDLIIGDWGEEVLTPVIYQLGSSQLDHLKTFMLEEGLDHMLKSYVFDVMREIAMRDKRRRKEVIEWYRDLLTIVTDGNDHHNQIDPTLTGFMIWSLVDIGAKELLPDIKKAFDADLVNYSVCSKYPEVLNDIQTGKNYYSKLEIDLFERLKTIEKRMEEINNRPL